jgi:2-oxoglutarate dehydrogenase E1 component
MSPADFEKNSYLFRANAPFIVSLYEKYLQDPKSVSDEWCAFFQELGGDRLQDLKIETQGPSWAKPLTAETIENGNSRPESEKNADHSIEDIQNSIRALMMIRVYRVRGHLAAKLDPLEITNVDRIHPELDPKSYGFTDADMDKEIFIDGVLGLQYANLRDILSLLRKKYCGHVAVEFMHSQDPDQKSWIQTLMEDIYLEKEPSTENKKQIMQDISCVEQFEHFLNAKNPGAKKFGIEGCESVVSGLLEILRESADLGIQETVLGMAHRGRINVLANVLGKPLSRIFYEFTGENYFGKSVKGSGDVKYHLGYSSIQEFSGKKMKVSLSANPSHLEAVDPVVLGRVRANQDENKAIKK